MGLEIEITANHRGAFQFKSVFVVLPHTRIIPNMTQVSKHVVAAGCVHWDPGTARPHRSV